MPEYIVSTFEVFLMNTPKKILPKELQKLKTKAVDRKSYYKNWEKNKKYRDENREMLRKKNKEYREKNIELVREKAREYAASHREERRAYDRIYKEANREEINKKSSIRKKNNRDKCNEQMRNWIKNNPEQAKKLNRKGAWKRAGLNMENFEEIYERYLSTTHCDLCGVELTEDKQMTKTTRCMDHSHVTGEFRNIVCCSCNSSLPENT